MIRCVEPSVLTELVMCFQTLWKVWRVPGNTIRPVIHHSGDNNKVAPVPRGLAVTDDDHTDMFSNCPASS